MDCRHGPQSSTPPTSGVVGGSCERDRRTAARRRLALAADREDGRGQRGTEWGRYGGRARRGRDPREEGRGRHPMSASTIEPAAAEPASPMGVAPVTHHRTARIDGVNIFYREAGPRDAPVVLLLHGFPTSSHMFRNLIPALADRHRVIAPDYPGYGQSDMPDRATFAYTFDRLGELVDGLLDRLHVARFAMYVMDYGAPVGWRLALAHPDRVTALIVQNGNAYEEGLKRFW